MVYFTRQPFFDSRGNAYGYEILFRDNQGEWAENHILDKTIFSGRKALIYLTPDMAGGVFLESFPADTIILGVPANPEDNGVGDDKTIETIAEYKKLGYKIALYDFSINKYNDFLYGLADIVKTDFREPRKTIAETAEKCRSDGKNILAANVETAEEAAYARRLGALYIEGNYYISASSPEQKTTNPAAKTFMQIIGVINKPDVDIDELAEIISLDAVLVVRLLKLVNSVFYSVRNPISSIRQAITVVGIESLKEWIYLLGIKDNQSEGSDELLKLALIRAKFCQEIAFGLPDGKKLTGEMYLMGLISLMHVFFSIAPEELLKELPVSPEIKDGLTGKGGPYAEVYKLCTVYERGAWGKADACVKNLGLNPDAVSGAYLASLKYSQEIWDSFKAVN